MKSEQNRFSRGARDGLPIALGYLSVSFAFGMLAVQQGLPVWAPIAISLSNFTGTGQFAGAGLIAAGASLGELALTVLIINLRYTLMSLSLSQRVSAKMGLGQRLLIAFGITDEVYAVAIRRPGMLTGKYMAGLILCSFAGWVGGTCVGALASSLLPESVRLALGIAVYAMFIAILVPPARDSRPIAAIILGSVAMSCAFRYIPALSGLSSGWVIIICGLVSAGLAAILRPISDDSAAE